MVKIKAQDFAASFVVFLIALPLSLGIALASGAPVKAGLISAVIGGVIVGLFGGAPFQVSGPAAGLTVMVYGFVQKFGFEATCAITIAAGIFQLIFGALGIAELTLAISPSVIHAMLAGIGILISLGQIHVWLGGVPQGSALNNLAALPQSILHMNPAAFGLGLLTIAVILLWNRFAPKKAKVVPASLIAVGLGTLISMLMHFDVPHVQLDSHILSSPTLPDFHNIQLVSLLLSAFGLTLVASAESLLCAVATDKLHRGPRAKLNRELMAQGLANTISGFFSGLPITGVIVRSSANISAGATSKYSAVFHGIWIFLFATFCSALLSHIPLAVLAGLLIHVGINLVKIHEIKKIAEFRESIVYFATLFGVVFLNLLWGIGIGIALALFLMIMESSRVYVFVKSKGDELEVTLKGNLSFLSVPQLTRLMREVPTGKAVTLLFEVDRLDLACVEAIRSWSDDYKKNGGTVKKEQLDLIWKQLFQKSTKQRSIAVEQS